MLSNILFFIVSLEGLLFFNVVFCSGVEYVPKNASRYSLKSGYLVFGEIYFVKSERQDCNSYLQVQTCV